MAVLLRFIRWVLGWREWPFHDAVAAGDVDALAMLLSSASVESVNAVRTPHRFANTYFGHTPLQLAVVQQREAMVRVLLQHGARVNHREALAAAQTGNPTILELLMQSNRSATRRLVGAAGAAGVAGNDGGAGDPGGGAGGSSGGGGGRGFGGGSGNSSGGDGSGLSLDIYDCDDGFCFAFNREWGEARCSRLLDLMASDSGVSLRTHDSLTQEMTTVLHLASQCFFPRLCARLIRDEGLSPNAPSFGSSTPLGAAFLSAANLFEQSAHAARLGTQPKSRGGSDSRPTAAQGMCAASINADHTSVSAQDDYVQDFLGTVRVLLEGGGNVMAIGMAGESYVDAPVTEMGDDPQRFIDTSYSDDFA
jgi:hypothetical protein